MSYYSYTELKMFRRCPKKYEYSRVRNLTLAEPRWRRDLGSWIHELAAAHYSDQHWYARHEELMIEFNEEVAPFTWDEDILSVPKLAEEIFSRYLDKYDDSDWEILHVEESFEYEGIGFTPDLVIRNKGGIWVVDHKTSSNIPDEWDLMADTQHLLYVAGMRQLYGPEVQGVIFNYMRTKPPTQPKLRKDGLIGNINRIDTDYETLLTFAQENDIEPYPELTERLAQLKERDSFFNRLQLLTPKHAAKEALDDAVDTCVEIDTAVNLRSFPRQVFGPSAGVQACRSCEFKEICQAELFGYDEKSAEALYTKREPLNREYQEIL